MKSRLYTSLLSHRTIVSTTLMLAALITSAHATPLTVVNGGFDETGISGSYEFNTNWTTGSQSVTGWTSSGYNFVIVPDTADSTGATSSYGVGDLKLWGPGDGSMNGLGASPDGGNYLAMDGAFSVGAVSQMIYGLTPGQAVDVSFYYAGAQQHGYNGTTTEAFDVSLGGETLKTPVLDNAAHGFTGWQSETLTFTPTSSNELLSFLSVGTPNGVPPFTLLDGVSMSPVAATPEPGSFALLLTGIAGVGGMVRDRLNKKSS
jgi:hypothetical protein